MGGRNSRRCGRDGTALGLAGALALLVLAGCASDAPPQRQGRGPGSDRFGADGPDGGERPRGALFVSPSGEPFRSRPGEPYPVAAWFAQADADHDGKLTRDEFVADAERFFHRLDADHDGIVDGFEVKAYETEIVPEITQDRGTPAAGGGGNGQASPSGQQGGRQGGQGGGGRRRRGGGQGGGQGGPGGGGGGGGGVQAQGAAPYGLLAEREPVAGADLDINSRITLKNFRTKALQRFALLDPDGRGYLVLAELPKTQAQLQFDRRKGRSQTPPPAQSPQG